MDASFTETWEIDGPYFHSIEDEEFMEEIRMYPVLYDSCKRPYKNGIISKEKAIRNIGKKFKATNEMVQIRYKTIRTRVSRVLKVARNGSGADEEENTAAIEPYRWLFKFIKPRTHAPTHSMSLSNISSLACTSTNDNALGDLSSIHPAIMDEDKISTSCFAPPAASTSATRMNVELESRTASDVRKASTAKKRRREWPRGFQCDQAFQLQREADESMLKRLQLQENNDDEVMLFCRSLAVKLRKLDSDQFLSTQIEILKLLKNMSNPPSASEGNNDTANSKIEDVP